MLVQLTGYLENKIYLDTHLTPNTNINRWLKSKMKNN